MTDDEERAVALYYCLEPSCLAEPGQRCRRLPGPGVIVMRTLKRTHASRTANRHSQEEETVLAAQAEMTVRRLGLPVHRWRKAVVLDQLRRIRSEAPRG